MCMITYVPANVDIPWYEIENGATSNPDGHGWAVASRYGLSVGKSMNFDDAFDYFEKARADHGSDSLALFHSRIATAGSVDEFNIHPFYVAGEETVVAHNGILDRQFQPGKHDRRSDTRIFADTVLPGYLTENGIPSRRGGKDLGRLIGSFNKLVILSVASGIPKVRIVNAYMGHHVRGSWFSNTGYLAPVKWSRIWSRDWEKGWEKYDKPGPSLDSKETYGDPVEDAVTDEETGSFYYASECEVCGCAYSVNMDTDICEVCEICQSCWMTWSNCECMWNNQPDSDSQSVWNDDGESIAQTVLEIEAPEEHLAIEAPSDESKRLSEYDR